MDETRVMLPAIPSLFICLAAGKESPADINMYNLLEVFSGDVETGHNFADASYISVGVALFGR